MELKGSKTEENLKEAFAGESQANRRYLYFASKADVEGYNDVAAVFRSTAEGETGHAHGHLEYLEAVGDPATDDFWFCGLPVQPGKPTELLTQGGWQQALESVASPTPVDLVLITDGLSPLMRFEVFRSGICLFERQTGHFDRERDRAFFLHADSEWLRRSVSEALRGAD